MESQEEHDSTATINFEINWDIIRKIREVTDQRIVPALEYQSRMAPSSSDEEDRRQGVSVQYVTKLDPPPKFKDARNYVTYKRELMAWKRDTDAKKKKQGMMIVNALCDGNKLKPLLKTRVYNKLSDEQLTGRDSAELVIAHLDSELLEDDLYVKARAWQSVDRYKRQKGQGIREYIDEFDARWQEAASAKCGVLSDTCKGLMLMDRSGATEKEMATVLTHVEGVINEAEFHKKVSKHLKTLLGGGPMAQASRGGRGEDEAGSTLIQKIVPNEDGESVMITGDGQKWVKFNKKDKKKDRSQEYGDGKTKEH